MDVSDEDILKRMAAWKAPKMKVNRGTLAKYAHLVGDASHGVRYNPLREPVFSLFAPCVHVRESLISGQSTIQRSNLL